jgi:hypothetical protein
MERAGQPTKGARRTESMLWLPFWRWDQCNGSAPRCTRGGTAEAQNNALAGEKGCLVSETRLKGDRRPHECDHRAGGGKKNHRGPSALSPPGRPIERVNSTQTTASRPAGLIRRSLTGSSVLCPRRKGGARQSTSSSHGRAGLKERIFPDRFTQPSAAPHAHPTSLFFFFPHAQNGIRESSPICLRLVPIDAVRMPLR